MRYAGAGLSRTSSPWQNMQARKSPTQNTLIWIVRSCVTSGSAIDHAITPSAADSIARKMSRLYQPLPSKQRMNVSEVDRERHDPQERHRRDVLRDVVADREQQERAGRRERAPEDLARDGGRRLVGARRLRGRRRRRSHAPLRLDERGGAREADEQRIARRPAPAPACAWRSTARAGTDSRASASSDARFDSANSR